MGLTAHDAFQERRHKEKKKNRQQKANNEQQMVEQLQVAKCICNWSSCRRENLKK